ncbi:basal-body rod modification protein flgD [Candidatus Photodesmus blepharus]|uniref:Basal-body rod modification protein FlgD n=1 Tax=Candidatus Photodesmus blepharonis TaxID=1179155 RepID=A0A084CMF4_9GAMM|nr:flagellar hook assembly protein FlgD [Candidatus Photodesmus blepharus]KEY90983.1 basal-body rod modification protein flgD [Candidatus Photodesmus blepharus]
MAEFDSISQIGFSYIEQLKSLQEKKNLNEATTKQELKQEDFFSLLTKQLAQQDPFKPVSNDQMIAQMASFATVDGIGRMNSQFEKLNVSMTSNQALQASSLVGRNVLVESMVGTKQDGEGMVAMVQLPQALDNLFVRIEDKAGKLVRTLEIGSKPAGASRIEWDGKDENGTPLPAGKYRVRASGLFNGESKEFNVLTYANVNSVLLGKGSVLLNLAGFESPIRLSDVLEVSKS